MKYRVPVLMADKMQPVTEETWYFWNGFRWQREDVDDSLWFEDIEVEADSPEEAVVKARQERDEAEWRS